MIKKEKVFELKIQDDDEVSGIDSISLVDTPAIEVNWIAFKKEDKDKFIIPNGEDMKFSDMIIQKGHPEEELLNDGWEVFKTSIDGKETFVTATPDEPSVQDTAEYQIRYKYILNPEAPGAPIKSTTREFCRDLVVKNYVYRIEDLLNIINDQGSSAADWRGGYNCRHLWQQITYRKDVKIGIKSSDRKGRVDGAESLDVWGYPQNDTRVPEWPSFSKMHDFAGEKVSIDYDDTLNTSDGKLLAKRLLSEGKDVYVVTRRREEMLGPVKQLATELGIGADKVHATNGKLKWETLKRLGIQTHYDNNPDEIAAIKQHLPAVRAIKFDYDVSGLPAYVDPGLKKKPIPKAINTGSFLEQFGYLLPENKMQHFAADNEKHIVLGPAMIPDQKIFRKDAIGNPYYVYFSPETIKMIAEKYMRNKYTDNNDLMHDGTAVRDIHVLESWIKEDEQDKSNKYGFENLPIGTWFISMKVNNPDVWSKIKSGELKGFSVSGYFEEVAQFTREEMFLYKVAELLKNIED
jgi:hypothetical protein